MTTMLDRLKDRISERDCPIKSIKSLIETIGMSEAGFYAMVKKGTTKVKTLEAICTALAVPNDYFEDSDSDKKERGYDFGEDVLKRLQEDMHQMKQLFEEQLRTKDRQIDGLQRMLESVLGKSKGATKKPLSPEEFKKATRMMQQKGIQSVTTPRAHKKPVAKLVAPR